MRVLVTGANGFLGRTVTLTVVNSGHQLLELRDLVDCNGKRVDIVGSFQFVPNPSLDTVIHIAGKAHSVPKSAEEKRMFFDVNLKGTQNLLDALSSNIPGSFVFISTVAVYGRETGQLIDETNSLLGETPYATSKIMAEEAVLKWGKQHKVPVLILRLPLIAGSNPPGNLGKMISGIKRGRYFSVDGGKARRSIVLAEDVARCIQDNIGKSGIYNLTDGYHPAFREMEQVICAQLNRSLPRSLPRWAAAILGRLGDILPAFPVSTGTFRKMSHDLTFDDSKARKELNWNPRKVTDHFMIQ